MKLSGHCLGTVSRANATAGVSSNLQPKSACGLMLRFDDEIRRALLRAAQHATRMRDHTGLSLSVEPDNGTRLYRSEGFEDLEEKATDGVMVWRRA